MSKDEAIRLLSQVCANFKGTLKDHQMLQEALEVVRKLEEPKKPKEPITPSPHNQNKE